jgi:hypothetical protein
MDSQDPKSTLSSNTNPSNSQPDSQVKNGPTFVRPTKKIISHEHLKAFLASDTCKILMDFIQGLSKSVERKSNTFACTVAPVKKRSCL